MGIGAYIREIGRGKDGARPLDRAQAADLFGQVLDGNLSDLEVGAFCLAMRIKGETAQEMAGFLDATHSRMHAIPAGPNNAPPTIVIPSYNGARKLPVLTPLLALLLARAGLPVLVHGAATEDKRVFSGAVFAALGIQAMEQVMPVAPGSVAFVPTALLCPGLQRLLEVRRVVHLRNSGHSVVKLMNPCAGRSLLVSSYTHPEYAHSMAEAFALMQSSGLLLRGTEGEAVADARRAPRWQAFINGKALAVQEGQSGSLSSLPELPDAIDAASTAAYIRGVLDGDTPLPEPIALQVQQLIDLSTQV